MGPKTKRKVAVREWQDPAAEIPARERLLVATGELMAERDTIDVSIADIAARANANVALVSYYFGGREGLLVSLAKRDANEVLGHLDKLMNSDLPPEEKMRKHIVDVVKTYFYRPYIYRLLHALLRNSSPTIAREVDDFFIRPLAEARKKMCDRRPDHSGPCARWRCAQADPAAQSRKSLGRRTGRAECTKAPLWNYGREEPTPVETKQGT